MSLTSLSRLFSVFFSLVLKPIYKLIFWHTYFWRMKTIRVMRILFIKAASQSPWSLCVGLELEYNLYFGKVFFSNYNLSLSLSLFLSFLLLFSRCLCLFLYIFKSWILFLSSSIKERNLEDWNVTKKWECLNMRLCMCVLDRERVCVCVWERERETERHVVITCGT